MTGPTLRRIHMVLAIGWLFPGVLIGWYVTYRMEEPHALFAVLLISLWANSATHWGAYGAARAEQMADPEQPNP